MRLMMFILVIGCSGDGLSRADRAELVIEGIRAACEAPDFPGAPPELGPICRALNPPQEDSP